MRAEGPKRGINVQKWVLGYAMDTISGDDGGCFGIYERAFNQEFAIHSKAAIYERMNWELSLPELPGEIRKKIVKVKRALNKIDWTKKEGLEKARGIWLDEVRDFTRQLINSRADYEEAVVYSGGTPRIKEVSPKVRKILEDYLAGKTSAK
jgi:hypothetical protein